MWDCAVIRGVVGNRGSVFDTVWLLTYFAFFFNSIEKNLLIVNFFLCRKNGINRLPNGQLTEAATYEETNSSNTHSLDDNKNSSLCMQLSFQRSL